MALLALGINHKTASVDVREKIAIAPALMGSALKAVCEATGIREVAILSTCNRTEIYCSIKGECAVVDHSLEIENIEAQDKNDIPTSDSYDDILKTSSCESLVLQWLSDYNQLPLSDIISSVYSYHQQGAVQHMMRVACGLDSLVLGEPQILGQLKSSYAVSQDLDLVRGELGQLFQQTFAVAKKVRTDTAIGENPVSVAYAAVSMAQHIFSDLTESRALLIGAGETIELVARHLTNAGVKNICVANRTLDKAQQLAANFDGEAILLGDIPDVLHDADIVIASTASQLPILGKGAVESALAKRRHRPMFMIDIAVPRDIEVEVKELDDVYLYTVDDLHHVIKENQQNRQAAALEAEKIILQGTDNYFKEQRARDAVNTLTALRRRIETLRDDEVSNALKGLAKGQDPNDVVVELARRLTNKVLHHPSIQLRKSSAEGRTDVSKLIEEVFQL